MPGNPVTLGLFKGGLHNSSGSGEAIEDDELFDLVNLEVDFDGSLANRPAISDFTATGLTSSANIRILGTYLPSDGRAFLILSSGSNVMIVDSSTGAQVAVNINCISISVIQSADRLYVIPFPGSGSVGGYFSVVTTGAVPTWTAVASIPSGEASVIYKDRVYIVSGVNSITNTSRLYYSWALDAASWNNVPGNNASGGFVDVDPGNGQKLVSLVLLNNDVILFKEHSTYRYSFTSVPGRADIFRISPRIGCPAPNCAVSYDNNNAYVLHDNNIYELYNYTFTKISLKIALTQTPDNSLYGTDVYGLTLYRDRLFVRYYANLYVYSLRTEKWCRWTTDKKFSRIITIPSADIGLDTAYASSASSDHPGKIYFFRDDRITGVGTVEVFTCSLITKTYNINLPYTFKALTWWGVSIATLGNMTGRVTVPNIGQNPTWGYQKAHYTWGQARALKWSSNDKVVYEKVVTPTLGNYARKFIKLPKKLRFRQLSFTIETNAVSNTVADASVRIWDITSFVLQKETVVRETS